LFDRETPTEPKWIKFSQGRAQGPAKRAADALGRKGWPSARNGDSPYAKNKTSQTLVLAGFLLGTKVCFQANQRLNPKYLKPTQNDLGAKPKRAFVLS